MTTRHAKNEHPDTRQHILDCGRQLVAEKGFVGVGLAEILTTAGVPKGSFYYYFASKEAFGTALIEHYFADYQARLAALAVQTKQTGAERLMTYFARWIETQEGSDRAEHCLIVKLAAEIADLSEAMRDRMLAGTETILRFLTELVASGQADGSIRNREPAADLAQFLYQAWLGASLLAKLRREPRAFDAVMRRSRQLLQLD